MDTEILVALINPPCKLSIAQIKYMLYSVSEYKQQINTPKLNTEIWIKKKKRKQPLKWEPPCELFFLGVYCSGVFSMYR